MSEPIHHEPLVPVEGTPEQTDNSSEAGQPALPQTAEWRPDDAADVAP